MRGDEGQSEPHDGNRKIAGMLSGVGEGREGQRGSGRLNPQHVNAMSRETSLRFHECCTR